MALPDWPENLPFRPLQEGTEIQQLFEPPKQTTVEDGPKILREWSSANWTAINYRMLWTHEQFDIFLDFVRNTLRRGRQRYNMPIGRWGENTWTKKVCYIEPGTIKGPRARGANHVIVDFVLNVNGW